MFTLAHRAHPLEGGLAIKIEPLLFTLQLLDADVLGHLQLLLQKQLPSHELPLLMARRERHGDRRDVRRQSRREQVDAERLLPQVLCARAVERRDGHHDDGRMEQVWYEEGDQRVMKERLASVEGRAPKDQHDE